MTPLAIQFWTIGLWGTAVFMVILAGCFVGLCYLGRETEDENGKPYPPKRAKKNRKSA